MSTPSVSPPSGAPHDQHVRALPLLSQRILRLLQRVGSASQALRSWLWASAVVPRWLPARWQRPWVSYLLALFSSAFTASLTLGLMVLIPLLELKGVLLSGGVVLVALACGAGPSFLAALISTWLLEFVIAPPHFLWYLPQPAVWLDGAVHLVSWGCVSLLASQTGWARRRAESLAGALRHAEQEAAARARELEAIFAALGDGLLVYDAHGCILRSNAAAGHIFGFVAQPGFASSAMPTWHTHYIPIDAQGQPLPSGCFPLPRILHGEVFTGAHTVDARVKALDGVERIINLAGTPLRNDEGHIIGAVGIVRDVTERRRLEQQTRQTLQALLAMAEALVQDSQSPAKDSPPGEPGLRSETDPALVLVAARLAELTRHVLDCQFVGIASVEPETQTLMPIAVAGLSPGAEQRWWARWQGQLPLSEALTANALATLQAGEPLLLERPLVLPPSGRQKPSSLRQILMPMLVGETLVGLLQVAGEASEETQPTANGPALLRAAARLGALVLERERLVRERTEARANELALLETQVQMETFLGMAGHELKTPITSIKLSLQMVARRIGHLLQQETDEPRDLTPFPPQIAQTEHVVNRLERLVNDLLDVSRARVGKLELHPEVVALAIIVREAGEEQRQAHPDRALLFHLGDDPILVLADADRIGQVVTNYLTNALKYSPASRPVALGLAVENQQARVWVRDEGPGLPPEEQEHIWERFHRVQGIEVQSGTGVGLGLGLHICRMIIERHHGRVGVESVPGQGSTFWFTLPLATEGQQRI